MKYRYRSGGKLPGQSPSMRREWIEMECVRSPNWQASGLPPCGGSGLKSVLNLYLIYGSCLPPCGGSGLKSVIPRMDGRSERSPSMRREWIEIANLSKRNVFPLSPSMRREWIEISGEQSRKRQTASPSMRREWIEMFCRLTAWKRSVVSLHAEGVD